MASINPPSISSSNGTLQTSISIEIASPSIGGMSMRTRLLNGKFPGPTLRVKPGDTMKIKFNNLLADQGLAYVHNQFSASDESNLHFHGLHVSGELPSDDVTYVVKPGESYDYLTTLPSDHMPGTHWLHPHRHGSTSLQVGGGAVLAIIVEDPPNTLPAQVENAVEVVFLAQYMHVNELRNIARQANDPVFSITNAPSNELIIVNGRLNPSISAKAGEWLRFRIIWSMWFEGDLDFQVPGCEMRLLAKDGIYIRDFPRPISIAPIAAGGRADIMVRCPAKATQYSINGMGRRMATIDTTADPVVGTSDLTGWTVAYPKYLTDLRGSTASPGCSCQIQLDDNAVNGITFTTGQILHNAYLGAVVERILEVDDHPYHQHVYPFQLVSGFGGYNQIGDWHDVMAGQGVLRYSPTQFAGKIMLHCHRLVHEDQGMMALDNIATNGTCSCTVPVFLSTGEIVGIVLGSIGGLVLLFVAFCFVYRRRRGSSARLHPESQP
eukprot:TRINITY_DN4501_c0_g1_i1.p1 TRINITY_DN4501_c0_g1~~TRINITY_DN4501_c0_g1_i1.p1  ORF type:complete len:494 (+),score=44.23 TRINITY_DN4501_c0_g1_i1:101-1582(+)